MRLPQKLKCGSNRGKKLSGQILQKMAKFSEAEPRPTVTLRVARFFSVQTYQNGKSIEMTTN
jgi:hypothetical protein